MGLKSRITNSDESFRGSFAATTEGAWSAPIRAYNYMEVSHVQIHPLFLARLVLERGIVRATATGFAY